MTRCVLLSSAFCIPCAAVLFAGSPAAAQPKAIVPQSQATQRAGPAENKRTEQEAKVKKLLDDARQQIAQRAWANAVASLQSLLDLREDVFLVAPQTGT